MSIKKILKKITPFLILALLLVGIGFFWLISPSGKQTRDSFSELKEIAETFLPPEPVDPQIKVDPQNFDLQTFLETQYDGEYKTKEFDFPKLKVTLAYSIHRTGCIGPPAPPSDPKWIPTVIAQDKETLELKSFYEINYKERKGNLVQTPDAVFEKFKPTDHKQLLLKIHDPGGCGPGSSLAIAVFDEQDGKLVPYAGFPKSSQYGTHAYFFIDSLTGENHWFSARNYGSHEIVDLNDDGVNEFLMSIVHPNRKDDKLTTQDLYVLNLDQANNGIPKWWNNGKVYTTRGSWMADRGPTVEFYKTRLTLDNQKLDAYKATYDDPNIKFQYPYEYSNDWLIDSEINDFDVNDYSFYLGPRNPSVKRDVVLTIQFLKNQQAKHIFDGFIKDKNRETKMLGNNQVYILGPSIIDNTVDFIYIIGDESKLVRFSLGVGNRDDQEPPVSKKDVRKELEDVEFILSTFEFID